jgi:hypothetical protein
LRDGFFPRGLVDLDRGIGRGSLFRTRPILYVVAQEEDGVYFDRPGLLRPPCGPHYCSVKLTVV